MNEANVDDPREWRLTRRLAAGGGEDYDHLGR